MKLNQGGKIKVKERLILKYGVRHGCLIKFKK